MPDDILVRLCNESNIDLNFLDLLIDDISDPIVNIQLPNDTHALQLTDPSILYMYDVKSDYLSILKIGNRHKLESILKFTSDFLVNSGDSVLLDVALSISIVPIIKNTQLLKNISLYTDYINYYIKSYNSLMLLSSAILDHPVLSPYFGCSSVA